MNTKQFKWLCTYTNWQNDNEKTEKSWMITKEVKPTKRKDYNKDARLQSRVDHQVWCGDCNTPWQTEKVSWFLAFGFVWLYYYYHYYRRLVISHFFTSLVSLFLCGVRFLFIFCFDFNYVVVPESSSIWLLGLQSLPSPVIALISFSSILLSSCVRFPPICPQWCSCLSSLYAPCLLRDSFGSFSLQLWQKHIRKHKNITPWWYLETHSGLHVTQT